MGSWAGRGKGYAVEKKKKTGRGVGGEGIKEGGRHRGVAVRREVGSSSLG